MTWIIPDHSKSQVDRAGRALAQATNGSLPEEDLRVFANWRSSHAFPLNTFQNGLRAKARICTNPVISQRLKRLPSAIQKLVRFPTMKLSQMQDIGGCRAVVNSIDDVLALRDAYRTPRTRHRLVNEKNYIESPKTSGYRSLHLVYRYHSERTTTYNGHLIEVQLRTRLQHAWATAVETAGAFLQQSLKSSEGEEEWLKFFTLVASAFALQENRPAVPGTPPDRNLLWEKIRERSKRLDAVARLQEYPLLIDSIDDLGTARGRPFFLLERRPDQGKFHIRAYRQGDQHRIFKDYLDAEKRVNDIEGADAVLVSADTIKAVRRAYPSYRSDTKYFVRRLKYVLE